MNCFKSVPLLLNNYCKTYSYYDLEITCLYSFEDTKSTVSGIFSCYWASKWAFVSIRYLNFSYLGILPTRVFVSYFHQTPSLLYTDLIHLITVKVLKTYLNRPLRINSNLLRLQNWLLSILLKSCASNNGS